MISKSVLNFEENIPTHPLDYDSNKNRNLDPKSYSYSTSLHIFTVTSSWVFSYVEVDELWIPTNHMGLKGLSKQAANKQTEQGRYVQLYHVYDLNRL